MIILISILLITVLVVGLVLGYFLQSMSCKVQVSKIHPPKLTNNPSYDSVMTETNPYLSFFNSKTDGPKKYEIEIDKKEQFNSPDKIRYIVLEKNKFVTEKKIEQNHLLTDKTRYYWRVRVIAQAGKSTWVKSRFYVDTESDKKVLNLTRIKVKNILSSDGYNARSIVDYDDPGLMSFWQSPPPWEKSHRILFDFGKITKVSRMWMLSDSNTENPNGWIRDCALFYSVDGKKWHKIRKGELKDNDTFRNIVDFDEVSAKYIKLEIYDFIGYAAQLNEVMFFSPGKYPAVSVPSKDYVLVIGNEHNGFTFTELAKHIESLGYQAVGMPFYQASWDMISNFSNKPLAIILSGNNADYPNLPMFEYASEFDMIRKTDIPLLGICAGHQFLAMAYGYSRARSMGWSDISASQSRKKITKINVIKQDPIFHDVKNQFSAPEVHSWSVVHPADEFEVIAKSSYIQAQKSKDRPIYGVQFHAEIDVDYNQAKPLIKNFLKIAKQYKDKIKNTNE